MRRKEFKRSSTNEKPFGSIDSLRLFLPPKLLNKPRIEYLLPVR